MKFFGFDPNQSILEEEKRVKRVNLIIDNKVLVLHKTVKFTGIEE